MKTFAVAFGFVLCSLLLLNGCTSYGTSRGWRQEKTVVEPYPIWSVSYMGGGSFPNLRRVHHLSEPHELVFPEARWGVKYVVLARYQKYRPNPKNMDDGSRESYLVERTISESPVEQGSCFEIKGDFSDLAKSSEPSDFKRLFRPNDLQYQNPSVEKKVVQFLKDEKARLFVMKGCFGAAPELQIRIVDFRYDR